MGTQNQYDFETIYQAVCKDLQTKGETKIYIFLTILLREQKLQMYIKMNFLAQKKIPTSLF